MRLPPIDRSSRPDAIRATLDDRNLTAMLVTDLTNIGWITGFTGSSGRLVITPDAAVFVTDGRYRDQAIEQFAATDVDIEVQVGFTHAEQHRLLVELLSSFDLVAAESEHLTYSAWNTIAADISIVATTGIVEALRRTKDAGEIARLAAAAKAADAALATVAPMLEGMTEHEVRTELEYRMRLHGADGPSYDTIVASGPTHAARPHHQANQRTIIAGDTVVIDVGGLVDGYHSDMTRSYVIGDATAHQAELYALVLQSQLAGLAAARAGTPAREVDAACRAVLADAGYGDWFIHGTGHGVGLLIHEEPFQNQTATTTLQTGDVVTIEPGLYREGFGGFRIEDLVVVTNDGCCILTHTAKDTLCLPSPPTT